jgi:hypothetical protein
MIASRRRAIALALSSVAIITAIAPVSAQVPSFGPPPLQRPTFSAAANGLAVAATGAMDAVCLTGSATKFVRVKRISITGIQATTAGTSDVELFFRTAANSGGASTTPTIAPFDTVNGAATAVMRAYTTAPTPGAGVAIRSQKIPVPLAASASQYPPVIWEFSPSLGTQEVILRGVAQQACVNFPAAFSGATPSIDIDFTWTEQ